MMERLELCTVVVFISSLGVTTKHFGLLCGVGVGGFVVVAGQLFGFTTTTS